MFKKLEVEKHNKLANKLLNLNTLSSLISTSPIYRRLPIGSTPYSFKI